MTTTLGPKDKPSGGATTRAATRPHVRADFFRDVRHATAAKHIADGADPQLVLALLAALEVADDGDMAGESNAELDREREEQRIRAEKTVEAAVAGVITIGAALTKLGRITKRLAELRRPDDLGSRRPPKPRRPPQREPTPREAQMAEDARKAFADYKELLALYQKMDANLSRRPLRAVLCPQEHTDRAELLRSLARRVARELEPATATPTGSKGGVRLMLVRNDGEEPGR